MEQNQQWQLLSSLQPSNGSIILGSIDPGREEVWPARVALDDIWSIGCTKEPGCAKVETGIERAPKRGEEQTFRERRVGD